MSEMCLLILEAIVSQTKYSPFLLAPASDDDARARIDDASRRHPGRDFSSSQQRLTKMSLIVK